MIALHNSHTLLFLSITLHARCQCIVTCVCPKIDCVPPLRSQCFYRSTASALFAYKSYAALRVNRPQLRVVRSFLTVTVSVTLRILCERSNTYPKNVAFNIVFSPTNRHGAFIASVRLQTPLLNVQPTHGSNTLGGRKDAPLYIARTYYASFHKCAEYI
jgi:hypothetical protein